jgi:hypothetical protein
MAVRSADVVGEKLLISVRTVSRLQDGIGAEANIRLYDAPARSGSDPLHNIMGSEPFPSGCDAG